MGESVTQFDIVRGLEELGLKSGDVVFVHSSLSSFGHVEGGAETVVQAFLDVLGPNGTIAVPIFRNYFWNGPDQVWDRDKSASLMGKISETVRTWEGNRRSHHAPHPIAAIGHYADDLTDRYNTTDFSFDSPFARLLELNAWIILLGVGYNNCTMFHLIEERTEIPYRHWVNLTGTVIENGLAFQKTYPFLTRYPGVNNDFHTLGTRMESEGIVKIVTVGKSTIRGFRSRDFYDFALRAIRQDPLVLVSEDTKDKARTYLPKHGEMLDNYASDPPLLMIPNNPIARKLAEVLYVPRTSEPSVEVINHFETDDGLILEEFRLRGGPNDLVPGMIAIPKDCQFSLPAVICLHGTGGSWESMMEKPFFPRNSSLTGWARELARRGFITVAITQFSHPPRHEPWDWELPKLIPVYGQTSMGLLVADVPVCVDYLYTRPEVDKQRIAVGGFSLGGISAFYGFVLDERISAAFTFCGGVGSIRKLIREGSTRYHSIYYYVPGILSADLDHPKLTSIIAPRPLLICGSKEDAGMPLAGLYEFEISAKEAYLSADAEDKFRMVIEDGPHALTINAFETATDWLLKVL